ncbi:uncharacterized protein LOC116173101 [Photinus pyralis]|uniref:uncharacterized protein LOC116173101 n=1 Tax=Photinus pyralis TaxID=7054 RepID=UPI0012672C67|nr:uncharacterized protein LOC116173101 [Photinus pyralis]
MKFSLIVGLSLLTCSAALHMVVPIYLREAWYAMISPYISECVCETRVDPSFVRRTFLETEFPDDSCLKCFMKCVGFLLNVMNAATGEWNEKELVRQVAGVTPEIASTCNNQTAGLVDVCEKTFNFYQCLVYSVMVEEYYDHKN